MDMLINKHIRLFLVLLIIAILSVSCREGNTRTAIALQPIGNIPENTLNILKHNIEEQYHSTVIILPKTSLPDSFINYEKGRRYSATLAIRYLKDLMPDTAKYITGITNEDIYTTKQDKWGKIKQPAYKYKVWGIFGLGYKPGSSCIISTARLHCNDKDKYIARIIRVTLHEIGHNHGLDHCKNKHCLMTDAVETIATVDNAGDSLCNNCSCLIKAQIE